MVRRNGAWLLAVIAVVVVVLLATDTVSIECQSDEPQSIPEALEEAGENIEDAAEELTEG